MIEKLLKGYERFRNGCFQRKSEQLEKIDKINVELLKDLDKQFIR